VPARRWWWPWCRGLADADDRAGGQEAAAAARLGVVLAKMLSNHNMPVPATVAFTGLLASFLDDLPPGPPRGLA
jgi:hypothetical protein